MEPSATLSLILRSWSWQPLLLLGLGSIAAGYGYAYYYFRHHGWLARVVRRGLIKRRHPLLFAAGLATLVIALFSPVDVLADLLFAAHMLQHVLLIMVAPPLILFGLPSPVIRWLLHELRLRKALAWLSNPVTAYALLFLNLYLWHVPALYEAALSNELLHDLEHALFFYTALFYWWRVIDPTHGWYPLWRWPPAKWVYLMIAAPPSYLLGSILWASATVLYPAYSEVPRLWGVSALTDQQYGGLLMWLQGWMYFMASMVVFFNWYDPEEEQA